MGLPGAGATSPAEGCVHEAGREGLPYPDRSDPAVGWNRGAALVPLLFLASSWLAASFLL